MSQKELIEDLRWARLADTIPPFAKHPPRRRGRRGQGIRYEQGLHRHFTLRFGDSYIASPWFQYIAGDERRIRWCQPDALLIDFPRGQITIFEAKYQHTPDAWWQLQRYLTIVREVFGSTFTYALCEVVKWYDCAVRFPEPVRLLADLRESRARGFQVHIHRLRPPSGRPQVAQWKAKGNSCCPQRKANTNREELAEGQDVDHLDHLDHLFPESGGAQ